MSDEKIIGIRLTGDSKELVGASKEGTAAINELGAATKRAQSQAEQLNTQTKSYWQEQQRAANASAQAWLNGNAATDAAADKAWALANGYKEVGGQLVRTSSEAAKGMAEIGFATARAKQEMIVLGREVAQGNFSRMPGTLSIIAQGLGPVGWAVAGVTAVVAAGVATWYNWGEEAESAVDKAKAAIADLQKYGNFREENNLFILKTQRDALAKQIPSQWLSLSAHELKPRSMLESLTGTGADKLSEDSVKLITTYKEINDKYQVMNEQTIQKKADDTLQYETELVLARDKKEKDAAKHRQDTADFMLKYETDLIVARAKSEQEAADFTLKYETDLIVARYKLEQDEAKKFAVYQQKQSEELNRSLTDALLRGFEAGKGFAQVFVDTVRNMFNTLILRPVISAILSPVSGAISAGIGSLGFSGAAVAASGSAAASGGIGAALGLTTAGGTALSTGAIMALHVAVPVAAAYVIAKYGFGWGNSRENVGGNRLVGQFNRGGFSGGFEQSWKVDGGLFGSDETGVYKTALSTAQSRAFQSTVDGLQSTFDELGSSIGDLSIHTRAWSINVNQAGDVTGLLADGIAMQLLPQLEAFRHEGELLSDTAKRLTGVFANTNYFITALGLSSQDAFGAIGISSADARQQLIDAAGGVEAFGQKAGSFVQNFLSTAEQLQPALDAVGRTFSELNISGIETNQQFADLVKAELKLGHYDTVDRLLSVGDAFNTVTQSAKEATAQLLARVKAEDYSTKLDYQRAQALAQAKGSTGMGGTITGATAAAGGTLSGEAAAASSARAAVKAEALNAAIALGNVVTFQGRGITRTAKDDASAGYVIIHGSRGITPGNSYLDAMAYYESLPAYASGGSFDGGVRLVGERGPELEFTGPSRIVSNNDSRKLLDNTELVAEVRALRAELKAANISIALNTNRTAKVLERFDGNGMPEVREE